MTKSSDTDIIDPFEAAMEMGDIKGRSPWEDAWHRLLRNRAAVFSAVIMAVLVAVGLALFIRTEGDGIVLSYLQGALRS